MNTRLSPPLGKVSIHFGDPDMIPVHSHDDFDRVGPSILKNRNDLSLHRLTINHQGSDPFIDMLRIFHIDFIYSLAKLAGNLET